jgi:4'-phosphopantetheinyl transferase
MLDIDRNQIHLWLAFFDRLRDETLLQRYYSLLTLEEQRRQARFHFAIDRQRYLVTRALVRVVLSHYITIEPQDWTFSVNSYGRPRIANVDDRAQRISFNISHTNSLILLGVTGDMALGVDVENYCLRAAPMDIADHFFAPEEVADLRAQPSARQRERFFEYWTLKECYIKARGIGLSVPLDQFGFQFPSDGTLSAFMQPCLNDSPSRWRFWQFRPAPCYLAAVCGEHCEVMPQLTIRRIVPLAQEEIIEYTLLRTSEASPGMMPE